MNPFDPSLLAIFSGEQAEHLARIRTLLEDLRTGDASGREAAIDDLLRRFHTLKGAARAVGLEDTEKLTHQAEEVLSRARDGAVESFEEVTRTLSRTVDTIEDILAAAAGERNPPDCTEVLRQLALLSATRPPTAPMDRASAHTEVKSQTDSPPHLESQAVHAPELLRINARSLDELIRESSDLLIETTDEAGPARFAAYASRLEDTAAEWSRLRKACTPSMRDMANAPEFHSVAVCLSFMDNRMAALTREAQRVNEDLGNTSRSARLKAGKVYQGACRIRMTPAESVFGAFGPMVRDLAQQGRREVIFDARGLETNVDLLVLQGLKDSVMHLLRNAVSHGIETPEERLRAGKSREGTIRLEIRSRGDRLEMAIEDDGRGIDYDAVEREARDRGLLGAEETMEHPEDIGRLIFRAGFSTSKAVTGVSGRGMGLSIVERAVRRLHGEIGLQPRAGGGTIAVVSAPISISTQHVLLVSAGGHTFGIATAYVERVQRIAPEEVRHIRGREAVVTESGPVVLLQLASLLGLTAAGRNAQDREETGLACAILTLNGRRMAFAADRLVDEREAIIKDTGLPDSASGLTAGAIPMEDGTVAVMLNVNGLFERAARVRRASPVMPQAAETPAREAKPAVKRRILVVDDSLTTRSLEKSILEAHGFEVRLAVDGLEALERLQVERPDLVISDVAMPRMTGFQLLEQVKKDEKMKKIPFILVTSLESPEEQQLGLSLGADAYIIKRKFDQRELLNVIREIL